MMVTYEAWNKALSIGIGFAKDSFKAYEEQAKADRQLARVAGESTEAFKAQATALQEQLGVSDDMVQQMQKMLLTYGEAPAEIDKTIRSVLDLSAATGQDAVGAISTLTSSVTTGRTAFKDLGLEYDKTGSRGDVLSSATQALAKKFAGASADEAGSLEGSINKSKQQFGELQETVGKFISDFVQKTQILESATWAFQNLNYLLTGEDMTADKYSPQQKKILGITEEITSLKSALADLKGSGAGLSDLEHVMDQIADAEKQLKAARSGNGLAADGKANHTDAGNGKADAAEQAAAARKAADIFEKEGEHVGEMQQLAAKYRDGLAEINKKADADEKAVREAHWHDLSETQKKAEAERLKSTEKAAKDTAKVTEKAAKDQEKQDAQWAQAGAAIGVAFVDALSGELQKLMAGEEMDLGESIGSILASVLGVAGSALGTIFGGPLGGSIGGALGGLAGSAIKGATKHKGKGKVRHAGGYAGEDEPARYHLGTWVGSDEEAAILQNGERVLSRPEVSAMGGRQGVESAVRGGGGGINVSINAFDGSTTQQFFERDGGRALLNAVRTGRGAPARLFGGR